MRNTVVALYCLIVVLFFGLNSYGQIPNREEIIKQLDKDIRLNYVSNEMAAILADSLKLKFQKGQYDSSKNVHEFLFFISEDMRSISNDLHFTLLAPFDSISNKPALIKSFKEKSLDFFHIEDVMILPGNVGYFNVLNFIPVEKKSDKPGIKIQKVLDFLKNTNSIIIDFRSNNGGAEDLTMNFASYFFDQPNKYYFTLKSTFRYDSIGFIKEIPLTIKKFTTGKRRKNYIKGKQVIILVSEKTFSSAEKLIYKLKRNDPSIVIIGERTSGSTNGYHGWIRNKYYSCIIPYYWYIDEENQNYNLQGKGIVPDIHISSGLAFHHAHSFILSKLGKLSNADQGDTLYFKKPTYTSGFDTLQFSEYVGDYKKISIFNTENGTIIKYGHLLQWPLKFKSNDILTCEAFPEIKFTRENGVIIKVSVVHESGFVETYFKKGK
jgi:hypothetical protein